MQRLLHKECINNRRISEIVGMRRNPGVEIQPTGSRRSPFQRELDLISSSGSHVNIPGSSLVVIVLSTIT